MLRENVVRVRSLLLVLDVLASAAVFLFLVSATGETPGLDPVAAGRSDLALLLLGLVACLAWPLFLQQFDLYTSLRRSTLSKVVSRLLLAGGFVSLVLSAAAFALQAPVSPIFPLLCGVAQFVTLGTIRLAGIGALRVLRRGGRNYRNVLVIGTGPRADHVRRVIERHSEWGLRIIGFVDDRDTPLDPNVPQELVHKMVEVPDILRDRVVDEVVVACPRTMLAELVPIVDACGRAGVPFTVLSDLFGDFMPAPRVTRFDSLAALSFAPVHHSRPRLAVKRAIDLLGASIALIFAAPLVAAAAIAIRLDSKGPIFFRQERCGLHGRRFGMIKLRTMAVDAEQQKAELAGLNEMDGPVFKIKDDPRITRVGRVLRRWSIDELPQLWNVLRGDMSLVGPRPPVPIEVAQYETSEQRRLSMRPGITCLWQVSGRNEIGFDEWVKLDLQYIDTWSLGSDVRILLKTLPAVLRGTGAS